MGLWACSAILHFWKDEGLQRLTCKAVQSLQCVGFGDLSKRLSSDRTMDLRFKVQSLRAPAPEIGPTSAKDPFEGGNSHSETHGSVQAYLPRTGSTVQGPMDSPLHG